MLDKLKSLRGISIREAIRKINENGKQFLLIVDDEEKLAGIVTDGDVRRALIRGVDLDREVELIMNSSPATVKIETKDKALDIMAELGIHVLPVVNNHGQFVDVVYSNGYSNEVMSSYYSKKIEPVFILAGGRGTRMYPVTNILPKPLIPLGEVPIIEVIMKKLQLYGFNHFILSLNYKAEMIKAYFNDSSHDFQIEYVKENSFLGTGGSLSLIRDKINTDVIVSNCDVLLDLNYHELLEFHRSEKNAITVVGVLKHIKIPYGVIQMKGNAIEYIKEKPEYDHIINAGIYVLATDIVIGVPEDTVIDMPNIINQAGSEGKKVGVYPVSSEMIDVGHWEEYEKAVEYMKSRNG